MKRHWAEVLASALILTGVAAPVAVASGGASPCAASPGEPLLDNERVHVTRLVLAPGESTGRHYHTADQLLVFVKGGVLKSAESGRSTVWHAGRVEWQTGTDRADAGRRNVGETPIEIVCVTLKPSAPRTPPAAAVAGGELSLNYPNIPGEDLLENDRVVVQRFTVKPGEWEGVHAHRPNMLYIHIKGGQWAVRSKKEPQHVYPEPSPDGEVGWMETIDINAGHESGNVGKEPIDLVWVTFK